MEFKAGQIVKSPTFIGAILKVGKEVNGKFSAISFPKPGYLSLAVDDWEALTRSEIVQHMVDNGWEQGYYNGVNLNHTRWHFNSGSYVRIGENEMGKYEALLNFMPACTQDIIDKMQEAHDYAQALNLAPNE